MTNNDVTNPDFLSLHARLQPEKRALIDLAAGEKWNYRELDHAVNQMGAFLQFEGAEIGVRVVVIAKNNASTLLIHLACSRIGAIFVPLNWRLSKTEIKALLTDCAPVLIFGDACLDDLQIKGISFEKLSAELQKTDAQTITLASADANRTSLILYTSGTTGRPKGVMLSEANLLATGRNFSALGEVTNDSVFLCDSPLFHVIGLITNIRPVLQNGAALLISDGFIPKRTFERMADPDLAVTHYFCVPQMATSIRLCEGFDSKKLSGLTAIFTGGAPHPAAHIMAWIDLGIACVDGYGMSEVGTICGMPIDLNFITKNAGAVGFTTAHIQTRIVDANDQTCNPNEIGELQVKGENVFLQYWHQAEATAQAFTQDGWFKTGDLLTQNPSGCMRLVGRSKDMYISGGENIYPAEIEAALAGHPALRGVAVIGQPDMQWGEVGHLFIVLKTGIQNAHPALKTEILNALSEKIARYKIPKHVSILDELPQGGTGKVDKKALADLLLS